MRMTRTTITRRSQPIGANTEVDSTEAPVPVIEEVPITEEVPISEEVPAAEEVLATEEVPVTEEGKVTKALTKNMTPLIRPTAR